MWIIEFLREFAHDESGHDGIEYAVTASLIALVLLVTFQIFGQFINTWFLTLNSSLQNAI